MTIQVDFWQLVGLLVSFFGACGAVAVYVLAQMKQHLQAQHNQVTTRLDGIEQVNREETLQWQRVERDVLKLVAELPMKYVMRDDYIRGQSIIEAKLDGLAGKLENAQLRGIINGKGGQYP